jgi:hypothetical protein
MQYLQDEDSRADPFNEYVGRVDYFNCSGRDLN